MKKCLLVLCVFLSSCATIIKGNNSSIVTLTSIPSDAIVLINGLPAGRTPCRLKFRNNKYAYIQFKKEGYESSYSIVSDNIEIGWVLLDCICGFLPMIVDASTGAWYSIDEDALHAQLEEIQMPGFKKTIDSAPTAQK